MTFQTQHDAIASRFETQVEEALDIPVQYDNTQPPEVSPTQPWCRLTIQEGEGEQASFGSPGSNVRRVHGVAIVQIFTPRNFGTAGGLEIATTIRAAFSQVTVSGIEYREPSISQDGGGEQWWLTTVRIPWRADE